MNNRPGSDFDPILLKNPPRDCEVSYSWVWNAPISKSGIDTWLDEFVKAGIKCIYILPLPKDFRPERLRTFLDPEYLTEEFFELVSYALRGAKDRGILAWIYDEGGWPSGGACGLTFRQNPDAILYVPKARTVTLACDERFKAEEGFIALFYGKRRLPDDYIAMKNMTLTAYYAEPCMLEWNRIDGTSETAVDTFIANTYEAYKAAIGDLFGEDIPLVFTDEPGLWRDALAKGLYEKFLKEYGYDIRDYIYVIIDEGKYAETEEEIRARIDWARLTGKLFRENTYQKLHDWCEENGVYFSGHLDLDNRPWGGVAKGYFSHIDCLRKFHVPGIDVIWEQIRYPHGDIGALDDETRGYGFFPRLASSAARMEGNNLALTETFSIYGDGLTPDEIKFAINYQAVRGINVFNFLTIPYGKSRCSQLMMRPAFCPEKPGFYNLKHINEYYAKLSYLLRLGYAEGDSAIYQPCADYAANTAYADSANVTFKALGTRLEEENIPFDIIDDNAIRDARDTGNGLAIGDAIYRHIAVPECKYMPDDVKNKISKYIGVGEPLYTFKNAGLRAMTRRLDNGRIWFIFNESNTTVTEALSLSGGKNIYSVDVVGGNVVKVDSAEATLLCGDIAVFILTDEEYETRKESSTTEAKLSEFNITSYERFNVEYEGVGKKYFSGAPKIDECFSGTVVYEAEYTLPDEPKCEDVYRISFTDTSVTVGIKIDGEYVANAGMSPMVAYIPQNKLKRSGKIELLVSNTAANEILAKMDVITSHPKAEVGAYNVRMRPFEERRPELKLGTVRLERINYDK